MQPSKSYVFVYRWWVYALLLALLSSPPEGHAQDATGVGLNAHYGFIMAHRKSMTHLITGHVKGLEMDVFRQSVGKKSWERLYLYPEVGVKVMLFDLGNPELLGFAVAPIPYISFPLFRAESSILSLDLGTSYGYISKRFNPGELHKSIAIGSHINGTMHGLLTYKSSLKNGVQLRMGIGFTHFSNGAFKMPNLGINIPTAAIGFEVGKKKYPQDFLKDTLGPRSKKMEYSVSFAAGLKELHNYGSAKYPTYTASLYALQPLGRKVRMGLSTNLFYNTALGYELADSSGHKASASKIVRVGIGVPLGVQVSRLEIIIQLGVYVVDSFKHDGSLYERIGFHYRIGNHLFLSHILKVHFGKADNLEFGLGYSF